MVTDQDRSVSFGEGTLSIEYRATSARPLAPQLSVVLQCEHPLATPSRHGLADVEEVLVGRGHGKLTVERSEVHGRLILRIPDRRMSATHARLLRCNGEFVVEDAGSKNGTLVNGQPQARMTLADGDLLQLGCTFLSYGRGGAHRGDYWPPPARATPAGLVTIIPALADHFDQIPHIARSTVPVIIQGETGTGKELMARAIHELSGRRGPLIAVNCGALPANLVEAELFGYRKGAFSGAVEDRAGLVRASDGGTLFLDEIGDLPLAAQSTLLRVLQEREVLPLGAARTTPVDLRVVCATHRDLDSLERAGGFRADLRARLQGYSVTLPPLRERREDMGLLVATLLGRLADERATSIALAPCAGRWLLAHAWPLNIRELHQRLAAALAVCRGPVITSQHLQLSCERGKAFPSGTTSQPRRWTAEEETHRGELMDLLRRHQGNISAVARDLGKERIQIRRWIKRYGLELATRS